MNSEVQFWAVPVAVLLIWFLFFSGKILMIPLKFMFRLSLLAIPIWAILNWDHLSRLIS